MSQPNPVETFLLEAEELLQQIEAIALDLLSKDPDSDSINRLFRAMHTLKGSGSMFGFDDMAAFAHHLESALEKVREEELPLTPSLVELILSSTDCVKAMLQGSKPGETEANIVRQLERLQDSSIPLAPSKGVAANPEPTSPLQNFRIRFKPHSSIAAHGLDPASLLDELRSLGPCEIRASLEDLPPLSQYAADQCYLSWEVRLQAACDLNAVKDVFAFVEGESEVRIELEAAQSKSVSASKAEPDSEKTPPVCSEKPVAPSSETARKSLASASLVRVPSEKLDRLVNLVGELVMNQSRLAQVSASIDSADLDAPVEAIEQLIAELHDNVLSIRMTAIGETFSRFRRLTHDLSKELGKRIELQTEGEETELDKTVLDRLSEPLVHLIRNSIDHGIEDEDTRKASGKSPVGKILLKAAHDGGRVLVTLQDDGKGFDPDRIRKKAIEKGLVAADANLSQEDIFSLIFQPGFSTAQQVTNVSGRGVGMDAVRRQIEALRGSVRLSSEPDKGATVTLSLPLTLAIIEGLVVEIAGSRYIAPMSAVSENVELSRSERLSHNGRNLVNVRGELVPYLRLRELFGYTKHEELEIEKVVVTQIDGQRLGLVVDRVLGSHQTVIQSLGRFYRNVEVVSGATIMGDGKVALILDLAGLNRFDSKRIRMASRGQAGKANLDLN